MCRSREGGLTKGGDCLGDIRELAVGIYSLLIPRNLRAANFVFLGGVEIAVKSDQLDLSAI